MGADVWSTEVVGVGLLEVRGIDESRGKVATISGVPWRFEVMVALTQGSVLSPLLVILVIE